MNKYIYLSAGHNPDAQGATYNGVSEYDLTPKWAKAVFTILTNDGYPCKLVPTGSLTSKVAFINRGGIPTLALEIHFNSNIEAHGSACLHYPGSKKGIELATNILTEFEKNAIFQPNRGPKEGWYRDSGIVDYFLRATHCPSVIVEPEFIRNLDIIEREFHKGTQSIAQGIKNYYDKHH